MAENFEKTVDALMSAVEGHLSTKTIVGAPIEHDGMLIFPMAEVSFGMAAGSFVQEKKNNGAGGVGAKMSPSAILIIKDGSSKIVNIKDKDSINKIIEMVPDIVDKITGLVADKMGNKKEETAETPADEGEAQK